ncbi:hypothetical protein [Pseudoalteromonas prydzensis]|uniref:hypothetical protein n=1 Tax=Pseudoalteromonas prydzensis TaxID=182141 RepID=UPI0012FBD4A7|nr:hypothetical protein [Pseudoalteromonas prydzensis]
MQTAANCIIPEDSSKLSIIDVEKFNLDFALKSLKQDNVVLVENVKPADADRIILSIAEELGLKESLELQAAFASINGFRENVGQYFMSVNKRSDYEFIPPHSEGNSTTNMQIASLYSYENSTDGGESVLMNIDQDGSAWQCLREVAPRIKIGTRPLTQNEIARAKLLFKVDANVDILCDEDEILRKIDTKNLGFELYEVLTKPKLKYSQILRKDVRVYWDSVASCDHDSAQEYLQFLKNSGLLKEPETELPLEKMDNATGRRVWSSGVMFNGLFKSKITRKLVSGDLIIQNNLTWTHSTANWTPGSGGRQVVAAFA